MRRAAVLLALVIAFAPMAADCAAERAPATTTPIPYRQEPGFDLDAGRIAAAFVLAVVAAIGALYLVRRRLLAGSPPPGRRLRLIERLRVSPRTTLLLVECDGRPVLLGEQAGTLVLLGGGTLAGRDWAAADVATKGSDADAP